MSDLNKAIIFAAGMGSRLGSYARDLPKTLLPLGSQTIFDRIILGLDKIGVTNIVVVTGYAGSKLQYHALSYSSKLAQTKLNFEFITNNKLEIGNIYSFWLARNKMTEDFLLFNSDVVFDYGILDLLKKNQKPSALVIDDFKSLGKEEMKVKIAEGRTVKEITKDLDPSSASGEYIGIMKVSHGDAAKVLAKTEHLLSGQNFPLYYEDAFRLVANEEDCLFACSTEGLPWTEIDTVDDMNYARSIIIPRIENVV